MRTKKSLKDYPLDPRKVKRVQKILAATSEAEATEHALDAILTDDKLERSHEEFLKSKLALHDTLGHVSE
jgi:hypothetical protein